MLELQDLADFSVTSWYPKFSNICLKTIIIEIPEDLLSQLRSGNYDIDIEKCNREFVNQIKNTIALFDNNAFVKSNWNAPVDSKFISFGNTLQVTNIDDLMLYLTASEILLSNFQNLIYNNYCIALRKWINIHPASEFRCIVVNNTLRGISPRDWPTYYSHFQEEGPNIIEALQKFFEEHIKGNFCRENYTFDVILSFENEIELVDFGPLNSKTSLYAFSWKEIENIAKKNNVSLPPVFRYLESDIGIMTKTDALIKIASGFNNIW